MPRAGESKYTSTNWIGKKFGKLMIMSLSTKDDSKRNRYFFTIQCECGNEIERRASEFIKDSPTSCVECRVVGRRVPGFSNSFLASYEARARKKHLPFLVTVLDIVELYEKQKGLCALSGEPLTKPILAGGSLPDGHFNTSIDRINSKRGYTVDNIQLVTKRVNLSKGPVSDEEFVTMCRKVVECQRKKLN